MSSTASPPRDKQQIGRRLARLREEMMARELDAFVSLKLVNTYYLSRVSDLRGSLRRTLNPGSCTTVARRKFAPASEEQPI